MIGRISDDARKFDSRRDNRIEIPTLRSIMQIVQHQYHSQYCVMISTLQWKKIWG